MYPIFCILQWRPGDLTNLGTVKRNPLVLPTPILLRAPTILSQDSSSWWFLQIFWTPRPSNLYMLYSVGPCSGLYNSYVKSSLFCPPQILASDWSGQSACSVIGRPWRSCCHGSSSRNIQAQTSDSKTTSFKTNQPTDIDISILSCGWHQNAWQEHWVIVERCFKQGRD